MHNLNFFTFVETRKTDMCKSKSSQSHECKAQSAITRKLAANLELVVCTQFIITDMISYTS